MQVSNSSDGGPSTPEIVKSGYLKKLKTMRKKYFVLWSASDKGPARLEYYDNEKKYRLGLAPKRSMDLASCFSINKKSDAKHKFAVELLTRDDGFSIVTDDEEHQQEWLKTLLEQHVKSVVGRPIRTFEHVWQVTVKSKGLGSSQNLSGNYRLCLTCDKITLVKMNSEDSDMEFPLPVVKRLGHTSCFFFMEVGRQAVTGSGEMWMEVEDSFIARSIHEAALNAMLSSSNNDEEVHPAGSSPTSGKTMSGSASWSKRRDTMPTTRSTQVPGLHGMFRVSDEDIKGHGEDDADTPSSLLKFNSSKTRGRASSGGESHFHGGSVHSAESPGRGRGRFSMPNMRSNSFSSSNRPPSHHRISQPISNSPPIPNSPLSESPSGFPDERFSASHLFSHSPSESHIPEDQLFGFSYNSSAVDSLQRYNSSVKGRAPESPSAALIREEIAEVNEDYINMEPSAVSSSVESDSYTYMNPTMRPNRTGSGSGKAIAPPVSSPIVFGPVFPIRGRKQSKDAYLAASGSDAESDSYMMMMGPSPAGSKRNSVSTEFAKPLAPMTPNAGTTSDTTPYMFMSPPVVPSPHSSRKTPSPTLLPLTNHTAKNPSISSSISSTSYSSLDTSHQSSGSEIATSDPTGLNLQIGSEDDIIDSYANMEFGNNNSSVFGTTAQTGAEEMKFGGGLGIHAGEEPANYMNVNYAAGRQMRDEQFSLRGRDKKMRNGQSGEEKHTDWRQVQSLDRGMQSGRRHGTGDLERNGTTTQNGEVRESLYSFSGHLDRALQGVNGEVITTQAQNGETKESGVSNMEGEYCSLRLDKKGNSKKFRGKIPSPLNLNPGAAHSKVTDFMNLDPSVASKRRSLSTPQTPTTPPSPFQQGQKTFLKYSTRRSLEELVLTDGSHGQQSPIGSNSALLSIGTSTSPLADSPPPNTPRTPARTAHQHPSTKEKELNYIDVDIAETGSNSSDNSSKGSRSPFRSGVTEEKPEEAITYATIDFTKSEGLRNISNSRESRF